MQDGGQGRGPRTHGQLRGGGEGRALGLAATLRSMVFTSQKKKRPGRRVAEELGSDLQAPGCQRVSGTWGSFRETGPRLMGEKQSSAGGQEGKQWDRTPAVTGGMNREAAA